MVAVAERKPAPLSVTEFRAWVESRPSEEHWELINGVPMMMASPTRDHQRIASNLESLLNDALERRDPARAAYQRVGLNLAAIVENYEPEPDAVVIDVEAGPDQRYARSFFSRRRNRLRQRPYAGRGKS
jgi:Uma2 family endonuclease